MYPSRYKDYGSFRGNPHGSTVHLSCACPRTNNIEGKVNDPAKASAAIDNALENRRLRFSPLNLRLTLANHFFAILCVHINHRKSEFLIFFPAPPLRMSGRGTTSGRVLQCRILCNVVATWVGIFAIV